MRSHVTCYLARVIGVTATAICGTVCLYVAMMTVMSQVEASKKWSVASTALILGEFFVVTLTCAVGVFLDYCTPPRTGQTDHHQLQQDYCPAGQTLPGGHVPPHAEQVNMNADGDSAT
jgi:hypothetical protein